MDKRRRRRTPRGLAATTNATGCRAFSGDGAGEGMIVVPAKDKGGVACLVHGAERRRPVHRVLLVRRVIAAMRMPRRRAPVTAHDGSADHRRPARRSGRNRRRRRTVRRRSIPAAPLADRHRLAPSRASKRAARRRAACVATRSSVVRAPARREGAGRLRASDVFRAPALHGAPWDIRRRRRVIPGGARHGVPPRRADGAQPSRDGSARARCMARHARTRHAARFHPRALRQGRCTGKERTCAPWRSSAAVARRGRSSSVMLGSARAIEGTLSGRAHGGVNDAAAQCRSGRSPGARQCANDRYGDRRADGGCMRRRVRRLVRRVPDPAERGVPRFCSSAAR